jgi:hypothetical protein
VLPKSHAGEDGEHKTKLGGRSKGQQSEELCAMQAAQRLQKEHNEIQAELDCVKSEHLLQMSAMETFQDLSPGDILTSMTANFCRATQSETKRYRKAADCRTIGH